MNMKKEKRDLLQDKFFNSSIESTMDNYLSTEEEIDEHEAKRKDDGYDRENELEEYER